MNEIDIKKKVVMTMIENCTMGLDNTGQERYSLNEQQFGKVVDTLVENLSLSGVVSSCTDKEAYAFKEGYELGCKETANDLCDRI
tara:strand:+ start:1294 stop:1548 length:255 start_codon:yes stop_codon:yes gene_type:complete